MASERLAQRAAERWGPDPPDPRVYVYAKLVASGKTQRVAFREAFPHAEEWQDHSVDSAASMLAAHEKVRAAIDSHTQGARAQALATSPRILARAVELALQSDEPAVAARMVDSLLDRSNLPRTKESRVSGLQVSLQVMQDLAEPPIEGKVLEQEDSQERDGQGLEQGAEGSSHPHALPESAERAPDDLEAYKAELIDWLSPGEGG